MKRTGVKLFQIVANSVLFSCVFPSRVRVLLLKMIGVEVNLRSQMSPHVYLRTNRLTVGRASSINVGCVFDNRARVTIGASVGIGIGVKFVTSTHDYDNPTVRAGRGSLEGIAVEDGAWIGTDAVILPGVVIGRGGVIAAGSVVTRSTNPHTIYGGVPAKALRALPEGRQL